MSRKSALGDVLDSPTETLIRPGGGLPAAVEEPELERLDKALFIYLTASEQAWLRGRLKRERAKPGQGRLSMGEMVRRVLSEVREREG